MKRNFRRFANIATATLLAACITAPMATGLSSSAAEGKITITGQDGVGVVHTYTLYQLFSGSVDEVNIGSFTASGSIEGLNWAEGVDSDNFITKINAAGFEGWVAPTTDSAADYAKAIDEWVDGDKAKAKEFAQWLGENVSLLKQVGDPSTTGEFTCAADGYYIIVESALTGEDASMTYHLLGTYNAETGADISVKASKPSVVKKVKENVKYTDDKGFGAGYNDVADYSKGDMVPFKLIATLPSDIDVYGDYYIKYTDALEAGFVAPETITVTVDGAAGTSFDVQIKNGTGTADGGNIKVTVTGDTNIVVEVFNVQKYKPAEGSLSATTVTVDYEAKFDTDAVVGRPGNYNDVYLTYSNNPNVMGEGSSKDENDEYKAPEDEDLGETDKDGVVVFTYQLDVYKYDAADKDKNLLAGAEFVLSNKDGAYLGTDAKGAYTWLTLEDVTDVETYDWAAAGVNVYTSATDDVISIAGLDDGKYFLTEIKAPSSAYNLLDAPLELVISATTANGQDHNAIGPNADTDSDGEGDGRTGEQLTEIKLTEDTTTHDTNNDAEGDKAGGTVLTEGNVEIMVSNSSGAQLPGTGGIGTTLFYLGGGAMVAIGGIYLISKKRANGAQE